MRISLPTLALGLAATVGLGVSSGASLLTSTSAPMTVETVAFATVSGMRMNSFEARILALTNSARASAGIPALVARPGTTDVARRWAYEQARTLTMEHNPALVKSIVAAGSPQWHFIAENVGVGPSNDPDLLFKALMNSPGHRRNILDARATVIGVGAVEKLDRDGNLYTYITQDFVDSYVTSYGATRQAATGLKRDAWKPLLGRVLSAILPGDQHEDVNATGGIRAGSVGFTRAIGGYAAVVALSDGALRAGRASATTMRSTTVRSTASK